MNILKTSTLIILSFLHFLAIGQTVPSKGQLRLKYVEKGDVLVSIKNKSLTPISIEVFDIQTEEKLRSFGLGPQGYEKVKVEKTSTLVVRNESKQDIQIKTEALPWKADLDNSKIKKVSLTLENKSNKSIPLLIPNVMNPNLSPNSRSGVDLKYGQEILFRYKGKKRILLRVDDTIKDGQIIEVSELINKRKQEINSKP